MQAAPWAFSHRRDADPCPSHPSLPLEGTPRADLAFPELGRHTVARHLLSHSQTLQGSLPFKHVLWSPVLPGNLLLLDKYFKIYLGKKNHTFLGALPGFCLLVNRNDYHTSKAEFFCTTQLYLLPLSELAASGQCPVRALESTRKAAALT